MVTAVMTLGQMGGNYSDGMDWEHGHSWWMVMLMIVITVAVVGGIIWAIVFSLRTSNRSGTTAAPPVAPNARDLLDLRYARGEIDTADYEERRSRLP